MWFLRCFFAKPVVTAVFAVALVQRLSALGALFRLAHAGLIRYSLAPARANVVLHAFHCTAQTLCSERGTRIQPRSAAII